MNLNLVVAHRRPKANFEHVGIDIEQLLEEGVKKGEAIISVGETYEIDETTVKRMHKDYLALKANEEASDNLILKELQSHHVQKSVIQKRKIEVQNQRSKAPPPSDLDKE